jgi:ABC-type uncharacterized transport system permease subunit
MDWMDCWDYWNDAGTLIRIGVSFMLMFVVDNFAGFISTYVLTMLYNALSMALHTLLTYYPVLAFTINLGIIATVNTTLIEVTKVYDGLRHADDYMRMMFVIVTITITLTTSILWALTL